MKIAANKPKQISAHAWQKHNQITARILGRRRRR